LICIHISGNANGHASPVNSRLILMSLARSLGDIYIHICRSNQCQTKLELWVWFTPCSWFTSGCFVWSFCCLLYSFGFFSKRGRVIATYSTNTSDLHYIIVRVLIKLNTSTFSPKPNCNKHFFFSSSTSLPTVYKRHVLQIRRILNLRPKVELCI
jgi:hypothetical protein